MNIYKPKEFAERCRISVHTLYKWNQSGVFPARRSVNGRLYYTDEDYERFLQTQGVSLNCSGLEQLQSDRKRAGEDFEEQCRKSWLALPHVWRMRISDAAGTGDRPADELILTRSCNILCEEKSTSDHKFLLSMLRPDQIRGLLDFEKVLPGRNLGLVAVRFSYCDQVFLVRLQELLEYTMTQRRKYATIDEFLGKKFRCVSCPCVDAYEGIYDFQGVFSVYEDCIGK